MTVSGHQLSKEEHIHYSVVCHALYEIEIGVLNIISWFKIETLAMSILLKRVIWAEQEVKCMDNFICNHMSV